MDKLKALETVVAIADHGSLTKAAAALSTSTPTVARTLSSLEASLSTRLFARTTRKVALTAEGRAYVERARAALAAVADADAAVAAVDDAPRGRVVITAPVLFGQLVVAPLVTRFLRENPALTASLQLFDRVVNLLDEGIDVGVRIGALEDSSIVAVNVGRVRRVVVASPAYLKRHGTPTTPRDLQRHNCVGFTGVSGPWWVFYDGAKTVQVPVQGNIEFNHAGPAIDAVRDGFGIGMFVSYQVAALVREKKLVVLLEGFEPPPRPISVVVPTNRLLPRRTRAVVDMLVSGLRGLKSPFSPPPTTTATATTTNRSLPAPTGARRRATKGPRCR